MNNYNKLLLDEIQAMISVIGKHQDVLVGEEVNQEATKRLESVIDDLDVIGDMLKSCAIFNS